MIALATALAVALAVPAYAVAVGPSPLQRLKQEHNRTERAHRSNKSTRKGPAKPAVDQSKHKRRTLAPYRGLGTWVDMYDSGPWRHPERSIAAMKRRGVRTLYLQTSNYHKRTELYRPARMARLIQAAHARNIKIVGWYVPGYKNLPREKRRINAALRFRTPKGQTFDSFALDIEATEVGRISLRNARMMRLTRWLRHRVGKNYSLGAIVPDVQSLFWPGFPYRWVARHYEVVLPMAYFSYRVHGAKAVGRYTAQNITKLRRAAPKDTKLHVIGGIGGETTRREAGAYTRSIKRHKVIGGSYYDYPIISRVEWKKLRALAR